MDKKIEQPNIELQQVLDAIMEETKTPYTFRGKQHKMGWLHNGATRKFTHVELSTDNEWKKRVKQCAIVRLNNKWTILLFYWILWRYYYYILDLDIVEVLNVFDVAKKKIQSVPLQMATILATAMKDTMMAMMRDEVRRIQAEQAGEARSA